MGLSLRVRYLGSIEAARDDVVEVCSPEFTIGRRPTSNLHLPDRGRVISGEHAVLRSASDGYYLTDTSQNGVLLNGSRVTPKEPQWVRDGDELRIGDYQILCRVVERDTSPLTELAQDDNVRDPLDLISPGRADSADPATARDPAATARNDDPFAGLLDTTAGGRDRDSGGESSATPVRVTGDFFEKPRTEPDPASGQDDDRWWEGLTGGGEATGAAGSPADPFGNELPATQPDLPAPPPAAESGGGRTAGDAAFRAFLRGLGLESEQPLDEETLEAMGVVFRTLLKGVVDMLRARSDFKNQMRLARTVIQAKDNNPFKMAVNSDDLLDLLFVHPRKGYLAADEAAAETVADLANHELAVFEGLRGVARELLERVNPERLEEYIDSRSKAPVLGLLQKARYWDGYTKYYHAQLVDRDPLMEAFARIYDESLLQLQKGRK